MKDIDKIYNKIATNYESNYSDTSMGNIVKAENHFIKEMCPYSGLGTILDIGCGTGLLLELLDIDDSNYVGIDISEGMLSIAKNKFQKYKFIHDDIFNYHNTFDFCISLFSIPDIFGLKIIKKSFDMLNAKGVFISTFINADGAYKKLHCFEEHNIEFIPKAYTYTEIANGLEKYDFSWYYILGIANITDCADVQKMKNQIINKKHDLKDAKYFFVIAEKK